MRVAAIDVGSNSIHMVVAQVEADGRFHVLDRAKEMVRLGRRTFTDGSLSPDLMDAGIRTLAAFRTLAERQGATRFTAVATSAVREARNGGDFIQRVRREIGLRVTVIPGREEARLVYLGVRHAIDLRGAPKLIMDAGGGSVEIILTESGKPLAMHSLRIGVARLTERVFRTDPPSGRDLAALEALLEQELGEVFAQCAGRSIRRVVGTSGTMLNLISIAAQQRRQPPVHQLHNSAVTAGEIAKVRRRLVRSSREERLRMPGLDNKRVDLIVAGACVAEYVMRRVHAERLVACTWALREGLVLDFIARHLKGIEETERFAEPRRRSVARLVRHLGDTGAHGAHVAQLALQLFDQLHGHLSLSPTARESLEFASLLHDIGHRIGHKDHARHSHYLITNGELLGFRPDELETIGQIVRYHHKALPKASDESYGTLRKNARRTVRALSALLRIADGLDRSHYGVVRKVTATRRGHRLILNLQTDGDDPELELWEARRRAALLEDMLGVDVDFQWTGGAQQTYVQRAASVSR